MIRNGDAVGVAGQIAQDMLGAAEGRFEIDHPVLSEEGAQEGGKGLVLTKGLEGSRESKLVVAFFKAATNLPRKTRLSTLRGNKKW